MLSAEAARLVAVEVLSPLAANLAGDGFPTMAGGNVFDSRSAPLDAIDRERAFTPVCAIFTREATTTPRGEATDHDDHEVRTVLEIVAELAAVETDDGVEFPDAIASEDPKARLTLAAFVAQILWQLLHADAGALFRSAITRVERIEEEAHAVPQLGLRWQRVFLRLHLVVPQDRFDGTPGLPEPARGLAARLPAQSYARAMLDRLAEEFAGQARTPLAGVTISPPGAEPAPIASI